MAKKKELKDRVEDEITRLLDAEGEPPEGRMKLLAIALKKCALDAKLEESQYGDFFTDEPDDNKGQKPAGGKRANGGAEPA